MKVTGRAPQIDPDKVNKGIFVTLAVFGLSSSGLYNGIIWSLMSTPSDRLE